MNGERIKQVEQVKSAGDEWPSFFLITDSHVYEVDSFGIRPAKEATRKAEGPCVELLPLDQQGKLIVEARQQAPSVAVTLEDGTRLLFDVSYNPFTQESWPTFDVHDPARAASWQEEYLEMTLVSIPTG